MRHRAGADDRRRSTLRRVRSPTVGTWLPAKGGGFVDRRNQATLDGLQASAALSVYTGRASQGGATGYRLLLRIDNGLPARWMAGRSVPLLTRLGLTTIEELAPGGPLRAHDPDWVRRHLLSSAGRKVLSTLLAEAF